MALEDRYGYGPHLLLDCYGCPRDKLADLDFIANLLESFLDRLETTKIMAPYVFKYQGQSAEDWGLSGVALSAGSHVSIHTFPSKQHAFIDIFSCQDFDTDSLRLELLQEFSASHHEVMLLSRGAERTLAGTPSQ